MVAVVICLVVIVTIAAAIVAVVAAPRLRRGEELLTPEGRQSIVRAGQRTREQSASAAGTTVQAVSSLGGRLSSVWAPVSAFLHQQFDRLESRPSRPDPVAAPAPDENPYLDVALSGSESDDALGQPTTAAGNTAAGSTAAGSTAAGSAGVGRPRPVPSESGPIPVDHRTSDHRA